MGEEEGSGVSGAAQTLGKPKRGLVISCPIEINHQTVSIRSTSIDPQELRLSLLFWDKLAWPANRAIYIVGDADTEFLTQAGILSRPTYSFSGRASDILVRTQIRAFDDLEEKSPGDWALSQGENSLFISSRKLTMAGGIGVELYRAIPAPDKDVPLNEILEFKNRRYDELQALRSEIDRLVDVINSSTDPKNELDACLRRIDERCASVLRVGAEWQFPMRLSNLKASLDLKPFAVLRDSLGTYLVSTQLGATTAVVAALTGASAASSFKITGDFGWQGLKVRANPYRYVAMFHRELF